MGLERFLGEADKRGVITIKSGTGKGPGYFERCVLKLPVCCLNHVLIISAE
jgi:hypothetical protein